MLPIVNREKAILGLHESLCIWLTVHDGWWPMGSSIAQTLENRVSCIILNPERPTMSKRTTTLSQEITIQSALSFKHISWTTNSTQIQFSSSQRKKQHCATCTSNETKLLCPSTLNERRERNNFPPFKGILGTGASSVTWSFMDHCVLSDSEGLPWWKLVEHW